jgi:hypothetical protein
MNESIRTHSMAAEYQYLQLAIDTVRLNAVNEKVSAVRHSFENKPEKTIVRNIYKICMRVAAILILLLSCASVYKYAYVNDRSVYDQHFTGFELTNTRGEETPNVEVEAYRNKNWNAVIRNYHQGENKSNKYAFLAAMADMQLGRFSQAISLLEQIQSPRSGDYSFQEEAEYYLSLSYLMNHEENKGLQLLGKIRGNKNHTYYPIALEWSTIDLKIIALKTQVTSGTPAVTH